jgi:cobalt/nickel transport system permease protein
MRHDFIDKYSHLDSWLHSLDPRSKLFFGVSLMILMVSTNQLKIFIFYYVLLIVMILMSKVPVLYYLKRALLISPFLIMIAVFMFISAALSTEVPLLSVEHLNHPVYIKVSLILLKAYASILLLTLLTSVTRFNCLLWAMRKFRFPTVITTLSRLVYTYTFLLIDELHSAFRSIKSRAPVIKVPRIKLFGNVAATILLKSISRSQMVYYAMISRKFTGEFPEGAHNRFKRADLLAGICFGIVITSIVYLWKQ